MRLKVKFEGYIDLDEEMIEFYKDETQGPEQSKLVDLELAITQDIENAIDYLKVKNVSVEDESKL